MHPFPSDDSAAQWRASPSYGDSSGQWRWHPWECWSPSEPVPCPAAAACVAQTHCHETTTSNTESATTTASDTTAASCGEHGWSTVPIDARWWRWRCSSASRQPTPRCWARPGPSSTAWPGPQTSTTSTAATCEAGWSTGSVCARTAFPATATDASETIQSWRGWVPALWTHRTSPFNATVSDSFQ